MARCREATPPRLHRLDKPAGRWGGDDSELDVFAAERYFNGDDALWCARSSSTSFSSAFRTGTHEHGRSVAATATAATSSSGASWNSRAALLPDGKVLAVAASSVEAEPSGTGGERRRGKPPPPPPSSHLRRWMLSVAGCACVGGQDSVSDADDDECRDEVEDDNVVGVGGQELVTEAGEMFQRRGENKELAGEEAIAVRVRLGCCLDDGDEFLPGKAAFSPVQLVGDGHRRAAISGEFSTPFLNPATTAASHEQQLVPLRDKGSSIVSTTQDSAFTIVAGNTARGGGSSEVDAAPSELGCVYPPSERASSGAWSPRTARRPATSPAQPRATTTTTSIAAKTARSGTTPTPGGATGEGEVASPAEAACLPVWGIRPWMPSGQPQWVGWELATVARTVPGRDAPPVAWR